MTPLNFVIIFVLLYDAWIQLRFYRSKSKLPQLYVLTIARIRTRPPFLEIRKKNREIRHFSRIVEYQFHKPTMTALTSLQSAARRFFMESSGNMLIMGQPGCGKSFLLKELQNVCESKKLTHDTLAMRGHNAHDVGGSTIHSRIVPLPHNKSICKTSAELRGCLWLALGGSLGGYADDWKVVARDDYWKRLDVLFIDEVFLVDAGMFALTDLYARRIRGVDSSFGGIRVCVLGDSFQMAPRGDGAVHVFRPVPLGSPPASAWIPSDSDEEEEEKPIGEKYIISNPETPAIENTELRPWDDAAFTPFKLVENKRQEGSDQVRIGVCSSYDTLHTRTEVF